MTDSQKVKARASSRKYRKNHPDKILAYDRTRIKKRASRNKARAIMTKKLGKKAVAGHDIHHVNGDPMHDSPSNLKVVKRYHDGGPRKKRKGGK